MNCCRNDKTYLVRVRSSLTHLILSKFQDFSCDAMLVVTTQLSANWTKQTHINFYETQFHSLNYSDQPIQLRFCKQIPSTVFTGILTSVEYCNRIPCVVLNRHTIPFALFFIWLSSARATENSLWIQQLQYNYNAQWISLKGTWKAWAGNPDFRQSWKTITSVRPASQRLEKQKMTYPIIPFLTYFVSYFAFPHLLPFNFFFNCKFHPVLLRK